MRPVIFEQPGFYLGGCMEQGYGCSCEEDAWALRWVLEVTSLEAHDF